MASNVRFIDNVKVGAYQVVGYCGSGEGVEKKKKKR